MRALFVMPHLDDEAISCGALISGLIGNGWDVTVMAVYKRTYNGNTVIDTDSDVAELEDWKKSLMVLGVTQCYAVMRMEGEPAQVGYYSVLGIIENHLSILKPTLVVGPSELDRNQDHQFLARAMDIAMRPSNLGLVTNYMQAIGLDGTLQKPNYFYGFGPDVLDKKLKALGCYRREQRFGNHPRSAEYLRAQAMVWGASCGYDYAEAYHCRMARTTCELQSREARASSHELP